MPTPTKTKPPLADLAPPATKHFAAAKRELEKRRDGVIKPIPLPWPNLAKSLNGGLWPRTSTILAGGTGTGKTSMAVAIAARAARQGVPTLFLSLELDAVEMGARIFAIDAGLPWSDLLLGRGMRALDAASEHALKAVTGRWPLHVASPSSRLPFQDVGHYVTAMRDEYASALTDEDGEPSKPCLVIVDYIQLLDDGRGYHDVRARVGDAVVHLRTLAKNHHAAMLLVSSVARGHYDSLSGSSPGGRRTSPLGKGDPARYLASAKESGEVEYNADNVLVLGVDKSKAPTLEGREAWVGVAKARWGTPAPWTELRFRDGAFHQPAALAPLK